VLVNSHDGSSSSYQMFAGLFRLVCTNGLVVAAGAVDEIRVPHTGNVVGRVIEGAYSVVEEFGRVRESAAEMKAIALQPAEQQAFGRAAIVAKYGEETAPVTVEQVLEPRRAATPAPTSGRPSTACRRTWCAAACVPAARTAAGCVRAKSRASART
jgi:hypothetical protein